MRFDCTRDELAKLINALYIYRENVRAKLINAKEGHARILTARVLERVEKLYNFFVGAGAEFRG